MSIKCVCVCVCVFKCFDSRFPAQLISADWSLFGTHLSRSIELESAECWSACAIAGFPPVLFRVLAHSRYQ